MVQTISDRMSLEFQKLVHAEIQEIMEVMAYGSLPDWEQYKYMAGKIAGLNRAIEILEESRKIVYGVEEK